MIYFGENVYVHVRGQQVAQFECDCGHRQPCLVTARGSGDASSPYFLDRKGADQRAEARATRGLAQAVAHAVELVSCPRCHERSPTAARRFWLKFAATLAGIVALAVGFRLLSHAIFHSSNPALDVLTWMLVVALPIVAAYELWNKWFSVNSRVRFLDADASAEAGDRSV